MPDPITVSRLIRVLRQDPDLAWAVCQGARTLGPWTQVGDTWWQRTDATGFNVATVRFEDESLVASRWVWSRFVPTGGHPDEINSRSGFSSAESAMDACDEHLREQGWVLVFHPV